jgi:hypothetical protein
MPLLLLALAGSPFATYLVMDRLSAAYWVVVGIIGVGPAGWTGDARSP